MDLGAGTGVLGFFCLQAGAKHVYAIEASTMADAVLRESGFAQPPSAAFGLRAVYFAVFWTWLIVQNEFKSQLLYTQKDR